MPSEVQTRPPRNEHELELRLVRLMGNDNRRMLVMRNMMASAIVARRDWDGIYDRHRRDLDVLPSVAEAVAWANELICKITQA